ncbi:MAG: substrate-binding domain-containing protein [Lachnospirales bacterium]
MVTTKDIAEKSGVSRGTVSRVLNNSPNVNKETRRKVQKVIDELNYIPNEAARSLVMRKSLKIALVTFSKPYDFWGEIKKGFELARRDLSYSGVEIDYIETNIEEPYEQVEVIDKIILENYDGVALCPNNPMIMTLSLKKLEENNIPVVLYNVDMPKSNSIAFVGCNHYQSGVLAGELFKKLYTLRNGKISIFTLQDFIQPIDDRVQGFLSVVKNCENINIVDIKKFDREGTNLSNRFKDAVKIDNVDGLFLTIDGLGVLGNEIEEMGLKDKFILVGYDFNENVKKYLKNGCITSTITHEPVRQSYEAIHILFDYLTLKRLPAIEKNYTKLELIMDSNS